MVHTVTIPIKRNGKSYKLDIKLDDLKNLQAVEASWYDFYGEAVITAQWLAWTVAITFGGEWRCAMNPSNNGHDSAKIFRL